MINKMSMEPVIQHGITSRGQPIYDPVEWEHFFPTWDTIGKEYKAKSFKTIFGLKPMISKHMKFLEDRGFKFVKKIGEGGYGQVWRVRATKLREATNVNGELIFVPIDLACKIVELKSFDQSSYTIAEAVTKLKQESELHKTLRHTNIVNEETVIHIMDKKSGFPQPIKVCIFMELCNGDLSSLIKSSGSLSEKESQQWFRDIVFAVKYLHDMDLAHLDIKPQNILYKVESDGRKIFKLSDFGLTYYVQSGSVVYGKCGTPGYVAPDMGHSGPRPKVCDIFSLGATLSKSLTGSGDMTAKLVIGPVTQQLIAYNTQLYSISEQVIRLIVYMVSTQSLSIENVIQHDWFTAELH